MKLFIVTCALLQLVSGDSLHIPDYLPKSCKLSDPKYSNCLKARLEEALPSLIKGVPELKLPELDPLVVPYTVVNRTLNDLVSIYAVCKNAVTTGFKGLKIDKLWANPKTLVGEIVTTVPFIHTEMEYDVKGQLLVVPLGSRGYFECNVTDVSFHIKVSMKRIKRDEGEYFEIDKMIVKSRIEDGVVKLTSKNPEYQFTADLIANFYNENPRLVMDVINPIYVDFTRDFLKAEFNKGLYNIPANELLPE